MIAEDCGGDAPPRFRRIWALDVRGIGVAWGQRSRGIARHSRRTVRTQGGAAPSPHHHEQHRAENEGRYDLRHGLRVPLWPLPIAPFLPPVSPVPLIAPTPAPIGLGLCFGRLLGCIGLGLCFGRLLGCRPRRRLRPLLTLREEALKALRRLAAVQQRRDEPRELLRLLREQCCSALDNVLQEFPPAGRGQPREAPRQVSEL